MKLSDVIKDGHTRSKNGGTRVENRHRQLLENCKSVTWCAESDHAMV